MSDLGAQDPTPRVVLVTGASQGVGRSVALTLGAQGHRVVAVARHSDGLEKLRMTAAAHGIDLEAQCCDVTDEKAVARLFAGVGQVDVLVNNVGSSTSARLTATTLADLMTQFTINAVTAFLCTREAVPAMRSAGWGRLIFVASTLGVSGAPYAAAYAMAKHAVVGLARSAAVELRGTGVTANAVCPTYVRTPMTDRSVARVVEATGRPAEQVRQSFEGSSGLGRLLEPDEVAACIAYLASAAASSVSGQVLVMDGGGIQH